MQFNLINEELIFSAFLYPFVSVRHVRLGTLAFLMGASNRWGKHSLSLFLNLDYAEKDE
jgi:hypothetical protein